MSAGGWNIDHWFCHGVKEVDRPKFCGPRREFAVKVDGQLTKDWVINGFLWAAWDFKSFSALSSAHPIFLTSCSSSGNSCCVYSSTVFQPNSNLFTKRVSSCLLSRSRIPYILQISLVLILHCLHSPSHHPSLLQLLLLVLGVYLRKAILQMRPVGLKSFLQWHLIFKNKCVPLM